MIGTRYARYKPSGLQWLPEIPAHWSVAKLAARAEVQLGKMLDTAKITGDNLRPYLRNTDVQWGRINVDDLPLMDFDRDARKKFLLRYGDLLVCEGGEIGRVAIWRNRLEECFYQKALHRVRPNQGDSAEFLYWAIAEAALSGSFSEGANTTTIAHLPAEKLRAHRFCFPPVDEQHVIAEWLNRETDKIDKLIAKQIEFLTRLDERRRALITEAVTRGLNPSAPMKNSGVEWIGRIPAHWMIPKIGKYFEVQLGKMLDGARQTGEHLAPYLRVFDVQWGRINADDLPTMDFSTEDRRRFALTPGDLIVNEGGSYVGRSAIWNGELAECYYQKALHRVRPRTQSDCNRFLYYVMFAAVKMGVFVAGGNQTTIDHLTAEQFRQYHFPRPPLAEQTEIADYLDRALSGLDVACGQGTGMISLLKERRAALITAAVTGQIDVTKPALAEAAA